jgi:hypothetical protein
MGGLTSGVSSIKMKIQISCLSGKPYEVIAGPLALYRQSSICSKSQIRTSAKIMCHPKNKGHCELEACVV